MPPAVADAPTSTKPALRRWSKADAAAAAAKSVAVRAAKKAARLAKGTTVEPAPIPRFEETEPELAPTKITVSTVLPGRSQSECGGLALASGRVRKNLADEIERQTLLLNDIQSRTVADLRNCPDQQGRTAVVKTLAEAASTVFGWGEHDRPSGLVTVETMPDLEAKPAAAPVIELQPAQPVAQVEDKPAESAQDWSI